LWERQISQFMELHLRTAHDYRSSYLCKAEEIIINVLTSVFLKFLKEKECH
jgi:hypothetical protein